MECQVDGTLIWTLPACDGGKVTVYCINMPKLPRLKDQAGDLLVKWP